ncbi:hypothetical protein M2117_000262 [Aurantimicrobium minutum]|nr:hypothetical protein [Aurantimicrobium minutum]
MAIVLSILNLAVAVLFVLWERKKLSALFLN